MTRQSPEAPLDTRQLQGFVALVDDGSVTAAARRLGIAQSTLSESIAALERAIGTALIVRRRGAQEVLLTAAGSALLPHARQVLAALDAARDAVTGASDLAAAQVDIIANESVSTYLLPPVLSRLRERWRNTSFSVSAAACADVRSGVRRGSFDVGFMVAALGDVGANPEERDVDATILRRDVSLVIFTSPSNELARRSASSSIKRESLAGISLFLSDAAGDFNALVRRYFVADALPGPSLAPAGTVEGVKRGVLDDPRALGILPSYAIADELARGAVVQLALDPPPPVMCLRALTLPSRASHPAIATMLEMLAAP